MENAKDATVNIAQIKSEQRHRQPIWRWECGVCKKRGNKTTKIKNSMSASYHANHYPGHNVIVSYWSSEGYVFDHAYIAETTAQTTDEPPF